jgi:hypothetical protein
MNWVKLWTTLHDDPGVMRLSDKAFRYYINAWSWCGKHETKGAFEVFGKHPKQVTELVRAGKFLPTDNPNIFLIHGWKKRQRTLGTAAERSAAAQHAANARWDAGPDAEPHTESDTEQDASVHPMTDARLDKTRLDKTRLDKKGQHPAPRTRDALFEAVAEVCGIDWHDLTDSARGALNKAVAQLRGVQANPDEVHRRAAIWPYDVPLTPPGLAKHWPQLSKVTPKPSAATRRLNAIAAQLDQDDLEREER